MPEKLALQIELHLSCTQCQALFSCGKEGLCRGELQALYHAPSHRVKTDYGEYKGSTVGFQMKTDVEYRIRLPRVWAARARTSKIVIFNARRT